VTRGHELAQRGVATAQDDLDDVQDDVLDRLRGLDQIHATRDRLVHGQRVDGEAEDVVAAIGCRHSQPPRGVIPPWSASTTRAET
jgi:hypothetical protein